MKLRTLLTTLLVALCSLGAAAQSSYSQALAHYFEANGSIDQVKGNMQNMLTAINQQIVSNEGEIPAGYTPESLAKKYIDTQFNKDYVSIFVPYFAETMPVSDIAKVADALDTPQTRTANKHMEVFSSPDLETEIESFATRAAQDLLNGKKPKKVKANASPARVKLFMTYYKESGLDELMDSAIDMYAKIDLNYANSPQDFQQLMVGLKQYAHDNYPAIFLNFCGDSVTDEDLRAMTKVSAMPEYKRFIGLIKEIMGDPQSLGMALMTKYQEWMQKQ